jgi:sulfotransferase family protein
VLSWTRRPIRQLHVMRYEDMLERPLDAFGTLAGFLRLEQTRQELAAAIEASSFGKLREQEDEQGFSEKPETAERFFREGRAGQWHEALTSAQIDAIATANREQMERFGYRPL